MIELVKSEAFRKPILDAFELKVTQASNDYVNLQDDKPTFLLSPINAYDNSSPYFYVSLTIHEKASTSIY